MSKINPLFFLFIGITGTSIIAIIIFLPATEEYYNRNNELDNLVKQIGFIEDENTILREQNYKLSQEIEELNHLITNNITTTTTTLIITGPSCSSDSSYNYCPYPPSPNIYLIAFGGLLTIFLLVTLILLKKT